MFKQERVGRQVSFFSGIIGMDTNDSAGELKLAN